VGLVITQHMPAKFTKAFAERLDRTTPWRVLEAETGDAVTTGTALIAPGSGSLIVRRDGQQLRVDIMPPAADDRFVPSVDRMFDSVARSCGADAMGVVLTGMGGDGGKGVKALRAAGSRVVAEAPETAVIFGMPQEAIATGAVDDIVPLHGMCDAIARFARGKNVLGS
jgi:two-component system chemotaxis response regulator CheB